MSFFTTNLCPRRPPLHGQPRREISIFDTRGVYFNPTEEDLIEFLNKKIRGDDCSVGNIIPTFTLSDHKPGVLVEEYYNSLKKSHSALAKLQMKNISYFFRYRSGEKRKSGWGQTGKPSDITNEDGHKIGSKRYLNYREGRSDGRKVTTWIIHEYSSNLDHPDKDMFRICKLMKSDEGKKKEEAETRGHASTSSNAPQVFSSTHPSLTTDTSGNKKVSYGAIANFGSAYDEFFTEGSTFQMFSSTNPPPYLHEPGQNSSTHPSLTTPYMSGNQQVSYGAMPPYQPSYENWVGDGLSSLGPAASNDTTIPESDGVDGGDDPFGFLNLLNVTLTDVENLF